MFAEVMSLGHMSQGVALSRGAHLIGWAFVWLSASLVIIAAIDVPLPADAVQAVECACRARSFRDEARSPTDVRKRNSASARCSSSWRGRRMMHKVPTADVVIVNPTHFAVALK